MRSLPSLHVKDVNYYDLIVVGHLLLNLDGEFWQAVSLLSDYLFLLKLTSAAILLRD
jgi:hypothetical protein